MDVEIAKSHHSKIDFDCDRMASATRQGLFPQKKLLKLETAQVKGIRTSLNSLEETENLRNYHIRDIIPSFLRQRICMKSGYTGLIACISDEDLLDCLHACAFPKYALDGISIEETLRATASSVTVAANAGDMPRFVGSLMRCANLWPILNQLNFS